MPEFEGIKDFAGLCLHSHDFRDGRAYKDKSVVVIGASYSSEDVASQLSKFGAKRVVITHRNKDADGNWTKMPYSWPENIVEKPLLTHITGNTIHYGDGSTEDADAIILCTGYRHHFPFLPHSLKLASKNDLWIDQLTNGVVLPSNHQLFYLSMQN